MTMPHRPPWKDLVIDLVVLAVLLIAGCALLCLGGCASVRLVDEGDQVVTRHQGDLLAQSAADAYALCDAARGAEDPARQQLLDAAQVLQLGIAACLGYRLDPSALPIIPLAPAGSP